MGIKPQEQESIIKMEQERLIEAFASQTALAIERIEFWNQIRREDRRMQERPPGRRRG